jgi:hypothetical protein
MKIRPFVCASSALLAAWLAVTFVVHVPAQRYLKAEKYPTASITRTKNLAAAAAADIKSAVFPVSASR